MERRQKKAGGVKKLSKTKGCNTQQLQQNLIITNTNIADLGLFK